MLVFQPYIFFYSNPIESSGDVEKNLAPKFSQIKVLSLPLELNSIALHNFSKFQSLIAYNYKHHFDIICLSKTYLNSDISSANDNLDVLHWSDLVIFLMINEVMFAFVFLPIQILRTSIFMNKLIWILQLMVNYVILFVYIGLQTKTWKNLRRLLKMLS